MKYQNFFSAFGTHQLGQNIGSKMPNVQGMSQFEK
jgi:hypothetical protein